MSSHQTWEMFKQKVREARPENPPFARAFVAMLLYVLENSDKDVFTSNQMAMLAKKPFVQYNMMVGAEGNRTLFYYTPFGETMFVSHEQHFLDESAGSDMLVNPIEIVYPDCLDKDELAWKRFCLPFFADGQNAIDISSLGKRK